MRLGTHLWTSVVTGIALYPRAPHKAALLALAGVLVDVDHYVLYALRSGEWNPVEALRYNQRRAFPPRTGETRPRYGPLRSLIHRPWLTLPLVWLISVIWPPFRPIAQGILLHLALDTDLHLRLDWRVWRRAQGRCEGCRVGGVAVAVHYVQPTQRGGSVWALDNRALLCESCLRALRKRTKTT